MAAVATTLQIRKDEAQLAGLSEDLARFEQRYGMNSADFFARYRAGQMGDDADAFEWNALYRMHTRLADAVKSLRSQLREQTMPAEALLSGSTANWQFAVHLSILEKKR